jgi:DNA-binding transcriptional regulator LsrR (DeoR family)
MLPPLSSSKGDNAWMSERHTMRKVREVLRLRFEVGCSHRAIQASTGLSKGSVTDYLKRAAARGVTWNQSQNGCVDWLPQLLVRRGDLLEGQVLAPAPRGRCNRSR